MDIEQEAMPIEAEVSEATSESESKKKKIKSKPRKKSAKKSDIEPADAEETANPESSARKLRPRSAKKISVAKESDEMIEETPEEPQILDSSVNTSIPSADLAMLPNLKTKLKELLIAGLPMYTLRPFTEEEITQLVNDYKNQIEPEGKEKILQKLLVHQIDGSLMQISNLAESCKEYLNRLDSCFEPITKETLFEKVLAYANNANYSVKHDVAFEEGEKPAEFKIWELKEENDIVDFADLAEVSRVKKLRTCTKRIIEHLIKLVKLIEKMKSADDSQKVIEEKQKYEKALELKEKIINEANQPKTSKKSKKAADTSKDGIIQSIKKMKVNSTKPTPSVTPAKDVEEKKSEETEMVEEPEKKGKEMASAKESPRKEPKSKTETPAKLKNNTLLTQFFIQKKPEQNKLDNQKPAEIKVKEKSKFRCIGSKINKFEWSNERAEHFNENFHQKAAPSIESLRERLLSKCTRKSIGTKHMMITTNKTRKIFVNLQDSFRKIKGKFESSSGYISGRTPLAKDPQIDYDMDSEEEFENQNAENLDEVEDAEEEDDEEVDEEESVFIVSDGHLSSYELEQANEPESRIEEDFPKDAKAKPGDQSTNSAKAFFFSMIDSYKPGNDSGLDEYLQNFMIVKLTSEEFPLKYKHTKNVTANGSAKANPNAIDEKENLLVLIRALHGCYASKEEVIKDVNAKVPACSKNSIERKIKDICSRDKVEGENKKRLLVKKELFTELNIEEEYEQLLTSRRVEFEEKEAEAKKLKTEEKEKQKQLLLGQTPANNQMTIEEACSKQPSPKKNGEEMVDETLTPSKKPSSKGKKTSDKKKSLPPSTNANSANNSKETSKRSPVDSQKEKKSSSKNKNKSEKASPKRSKSTSKKKREARTTPTKTEIENVHPNSEIMLEKQLPFDIEP